jgi:hypothetical protein
MILWKCHPKKNGKWNFLWENLGETREKQALTDINCSIDHVVEQI